MNIYTCVCVPPKYCDLWLNRKKTNLNVMYNKRNQTYHLVSGCTHSWGLITMCHEVLCSPFTTVWMQSPENHVSPILLWYINPLIIPVCAYQACLSNRLAMAYDLHKLAIHNSVLVGKARPISYEEILNQHYIWVWGGTPFLHDFDKHVSPGDGTTLAASLRTARASYYIFSPYSACVAIQCET